ncbi:MAG TPA: hypothetical protein VJA82_12380 [Sediminibacterium sp.]|uniref:hypothetical protein n=1 Tax=Sediminibacterium sp. TaxID=1917865 RepID=UPI0008AE80C8|nr:hypothetical protein [Sediminibacterium sp.]OHC86474.1 MAG: hypothetical protein A2472_02600 [Sphingobacteriia bacterium RIFOXYC2_FULL_35_18]OHC89987.1 MAG: hypothetical protein A2546_11850 [Sphingobacteriia bacterium RIFOXYD2_FULL_35_12]HLD54096.1 hypothetical protein [Sediminibacterium sp.]
MRIIKACNYFFFLSLFSIACSKNSSDPNGGATGTVANNVVYYIDSANIHTTDINGANAKLVVAVTPPSNLNSYIGDACVASDGSKLYFFHITSGSNPSTKIVSVNKDGSSLTNIATLAISTGVNYKSIKQLSNGKLAFIKNNFGSNPISTSIEVINSDGTGQEKLATVPLGFTNHQIANDGKRFVITSSAAIPLAYSGTIVNSNMGDPKSIVNSRNVLTTKISSDGTKIVYAKMNGTNKIDLYSYTTATEAEVLVKTVTLPADITSLSTWTVRLNWMEGSSKILLSFAKDSNFGTVDGYLNCVLINADGSGEKTWKINNQDDWLAFTE